MSMKEAQAVLLFISKRGSGNDEMVSQVVLQSLRIFVALLSNNCNCEIDQSLLILTADLEQSPTFEHFAVFAALHQNKLDTEYDFLRRKEENLCYNYQIRLDVADPCLLTFYQLCNKPLVMSSMAEFLQSAYFEMCAVHFRFGNWLMKLGFFLS